MSMTKTGETASPGLAGQGLGDASTSSSWTSGFKALVLLWLHCLPQAEGPEISHDDSCFSSISFITVGSARLTVAFRTNPISLFIALGFPFFISITT